MHPGFSPVEVRKQDNGLLTLVLADKDGNKKELPDNDHVSRRRLHLRLRRAGRRALASRGQRAARMQHGSCVVACCTLAAARARSCAAGRALMHACVLRRR